MNEEPITDKTSLFEKGMALFALIVCDGGHRSVRELAQEVNIPLSTAYRLIGEQRRAGWLSPAGRGRYMPGPGFLDLAANVDQRALLVNIARPQLRGLAQQLGQTVHLGVLENDMVTYLLKESGGGCPVFTQEGMQLEAYCSAIGKMLLACLPDEQREHYIASGPFVALTKNTIVSADELRKTLKAIKEADYAIDDEEVFEGLRCIAIPIRDHHGKAVAAVSISRTVPATKPIEEATLLNRLRGCAKRITKSL